MGREVCILCGVGVWLGFLCRHCAVPPWRHPGQFISIEHVRNQWQKEGAGGGWVPSCCNTPLTLLAKQQLLTSLSVFLLSLLLPFALQTTLFSLRFVHLIPLWLLSTLKKINSAIFSGSAPLQITVSCSEWIIHQPNSRLPPKGLTQSFGTPAGRCLWLQGWQSVEKAVHCERHQQGCSSVLLLPRKCEHVDVCS